MLDDHEVEENFEGRDGGRNQRQVDEGLRAFESFQLMLTPAIAHPQTPATRRGYSYCASAGGFGFFVADTRSERSRPAGRHSAEARIMESGRDFPALLSWLEASNDPNDPSRPKFVVSPSVVFPWARETHGDVAYSLRSDAWDGYPHSLRDLLLLIAEREIQNVVFLSGDYHCSLFCEARLQRSGRRPVHAYSVVSSGLYSPYPFANTQAADLDMSYRGTLGVWFPGLAGADSLQISYRTPHCGQRDSFALVKVAATQGAWEMTVDFHSHSGVARAARVAF
jgi:cholesterol oxidase